MLLFFFLSPKWSPTPTFRNPSLYSYTGRCRNCPRSNLPDLFLSRAPTSFHGSSTGTSSFKVSPYPSQNLPPVYLRRSRRPRYVAEHLNRAEWLPRAEVPFPDPRPKLKSPRVPSLLPKSFKSLTPLRPFPASIFSFGLKETVSYSSLVIPTPIVLPSLLPLFDDPPFHT